MFKAIEEKFLKWDFITTENLHGVKAYHQESEKTTHKIGHNFCKSQIREGTFI